MDSLCRSPAWWMAQPQLFCGRYEILRAPTFNVRYIFTLQSSDTVIRIHMGCLSIDEK
jgi:hypothetical protein